MSLDRIEALTRSLAAPTSRRGTLKLLGGGIVGGLVLATGRRETTAQDGTLEIPVLFESLLGSFEGIFEVTRFAIQHGKVVAIGTLTGEVFDAAGYLIGTVEQALTLPGLGSPSRPRQILRLGPGPIDYYPLGPHVHLNKIVLDIKAEP